MNLSKPSALTSTPEPTMSTTESTAYVTTHVMKSKSLKQQRPQPIYSPPGGLHVPRQHHHQHHPYLPQRPLYHPARQLSPLNSQDSLANGLVSGKLTVKTSTNNHNGLSSSAAGLLANGNGHLLNTAAPRLSIGTVGTASDMMGSSLLGPGPMTDTPGAVQGYLAGGLPLLGNQLLGSMGNHGQPLGGLLQLGASNLAAQLSVLSTQIAALNVN